jgi:hypothetical protein
MTLASASVPIGFLIGDANSDRSVNSADATLVRGRSGQAVTAANFTSDVNVDGFINVGDTIVVRNSSGDTLTAPTATE